MNHFLSWGYYYPHPGMSKTISMVLDATFSTGSKAKDSLYLPVEIYDYAES